MICRDDSTLQLFVTSSSFVMASALQKVRMCGTESLHLRRLAVLALPLHGTHWNRTFDVSHWPS